MKFEWWKHCIGVLVLLAVNCNGDETEEDAEKQGGSATKGVVIGMIAAMVGFSLVYPIEFILYSPIYRQFQKGRGFDPVAFFDAIPHVLPRMVSPSALEFYANRVLLFCPRLAIELGLYAAFRGTGPFNAGKGIVGSAVAGVGGAAYSYPFRLVEREPRLRSASYWTLLMYLFRTAQHRGPWVLYAGFTYNMPGAIIHQFIRFLTLEVASKALQEAGTAKLAAAPLAVVAATMLSPAVERFVIIVETHPFSLDEFLFNRKGGTRKFDPDFAFLKDFIFYWFRLYFRVGLWESLGYLRLRTEVVATMLALAIHHSIVST